ncbi:MAG: hypothetical protein R3C56_36880 [Pirellulaceae bacterium]
MPEAEQQQWTEQLSRIIQKDPSRNARGGGNGGSTPSDKRSNGALNFASGDDVEKVRLAACHA